VRSYIRLAEAQSRPRTDNSTSKIQISWKRPTENWSYFR